MQKRFFVFLCGILLCALVSMAPLCGDDDDDNDSGGGDDDAGDDDSSQPSPEVWQDIDTGWNWLQINPPTGQCYDWYQADLGCKAANAEGRSWSLPSISELRSLVTGCDELYTDGECGLTDSCSSSEDCYNSDACLACEEGQGPNNGCYSLPGLSGECFIYWSSTFNTLYENDEEAWYIDYRYADIMAGSPEGCAQKLRCISKD